MPQVGGKRILIIGSIACGDGWDRISSILVVLAGYELIVGNAIAYKSKYTSYWAIVFVTASGLLILVWE